MQLDRTNSRIPVKHTSNVSGGKGAAGRLRSHVEAVPGENPSRSEVEPRIKPEEWSISQCDSSAIHIPTERTRE